MNIYYRIWADAIGFERSKHGHIRNWKPYVILGITFCQGLNFATLLLLLGIWIKSSFFFTIDLFPGRMLDGAVSGILTLFVPFLIINYFLIFNKQKYKSIIKQYPFKNGKLYAIYFVISILLFFTPVLIGFIKSRM